MSDTELVGLDVTNGTQKAGHIAQLGQRKTT